MSGTETWQLISPLLSGIADTKEGCEAYVIVYRALKEMDEKAGVQDD